MLPTTRVRLLGNGTEMVINTADFNPSVHEAVGAAPAASLSASSAPNAPAPTASVSNAASEKHQTAAADLLGLNVKKATAAIEKVKDVALLDVVEAAEVAGQSRKGVLSAITARRTALAAQ